MAAAAALEAADMQHATSMPKDDVRALIDQLVRSAPGQASPRDTGGPCGRPLPGPPDVPWPREAELQGSRWQLLKAAEMDSLNAELSDLRRSVTDLKGSLSQSDADKAVLLAELEKQLLENGVLAAKCAQLESEKGDRDLQLAALQAAAAAILDQSNGKLLECATNAPGTPQIGGVSQEGGVASFVWRPAREGGVADFVEAILSDVRRLEVDAAAGAAEHAACASWAQRDKVARIRADLYCLLHKLTLYECGGSESTTAVGSVAAATDGGAGAAGGATAGSSPSTVAWSFAQEPVGACSVRAWPPEHAKEPLGVRSYCDIVAGARGKEPAGVLSCCEVGAGARGKEMFSGADGAASDLIALMASPCRTRRVTTPQRTRVTSSYVVRSSGAPVQTVPMAPPVAAVVAQPRWPSGIATTGGPLNPAASQCLGTSHAYRQFVGSPSRSSTPTPVRQRVRSSSPTRRCSNSSVAPPSTRASLPPGSPLNSRASLPSRIPHGHGVIGNAVQVNPATPRRTLPPFSSSAGHPAVWLGCAPPSCTSGATDSR